MPEHLWLSLWLCWLREFLSPQPGGGQGDLQGATGTPVVGERERGGGAGVCVRFRYNVRGRQSQPRAMLWSLLMTLLRVSAGPCHPG